MEQGTQIKAKVRVPGGTRAARRMRREGRIPAIVYGHKETPVAVSLPERELLAALAHGAHLVALDIDGSANQCLIKEVQYDHLGDTPVHVDLTRVSLDERVKVTIPIELRGTPAGVSDGGVLDQMLANVEVECVVTDIPDSIRVRVSGLALNQTLRVGELDLPEGVTPMLPETEAVCTVRALGEEPEAEEAEAEAEEGPAQPEVIAREKGEQESEETNK